MNNRNLGFGVFLLSLGILWLLFNFGILDWSILTSIFTLWPLLLVMVGINIIFGKNQVVKALSWLAFLAVIIIYGYANQRPSAPQIAGEEKIISIEKETTTKNGEVKLDLGGVRLEVGAENTKLIDALVTDPETRHSIEYSDSNETANVRFYKNRVRVVPGEKFNHDFRLNLNKDVIWDMKVNVGAANGTLDLSELKVKSLDMDTGAVNMELIFGDNMQFCDVKIDSGASKVDVYIPDSVGARVKFDGGLSNTNFKELGWEKRGGYYFSPNYDNADSKINFDVDMGVGKFKINPEGKVVKEEHPVAI